MSGQINPYAFLNGGGELGALMRVHDWAATPLGPIETWPQPLKTATSLLLRSPVPLVMLWGEDGVMIYNDAYSVFAGARHPQLLGSKVREGWPEVADFNDNVMKVGLAGGTLAYKDQELTLNRDGTPRPAWMNLDYSPVLDEAGEPAGVIAVVIETTERVLAERRERLEKQRLYQVFEQAPSFICTMRGPEHHYEFVNAAHRALFGSGEWIGRPLREAFPDIADQGFYEIMDQVYATGERYVAENVPVRFASNREAEPETRILQFVYEPMRDETGAITGIFCEGYDVTGRHRAEAALKESEDRLRFLDALGQATATATSADEILAITTRRVAEHMGVSVCAYADMDPDEDGFTIRGDYAAPGSHSITGHYSLKDFGRLAVANLSAGKPLIVNDNLAELAPDEAATFQAIGIAATICMPLVKEGRLTALMAIHDKVPRRWTAAELAMITEVVERSWAHVERVRAAAELANSEARYRMLFQALDEGFMVIEQLPTEEDGLRDYRYVVMNQAACAMFGKPDLSGQTMRGNFPGEDEFWYDMYDRVVETGEGIRFEHGSVSQGMVLETYLSPVDDPALKRVMVVMQDVTKRRAAAEALRDLNEQLETRVAEALAERRILADIVEGTQAFVQVVDVHFRFLAINRASADEFERIFGVRPKVGDNMLEILADQPENQAAVRDIWSRALSSDTAFTEISEFGDPNRARRFYEMRFSPLVDAAGRRIGAYQFVYDVTERLAEQARLRQAEEALRQSQKMETIGQLTGGVAHDFNNLLTPIVGALDVVRRRLKDDDRAMRLADGALQAADRARTLVQRLLAFSRRQHLQPRPVNVGELVEGMGDLIARSIGPRIRLTLNAPRDLPAAMVDPNQLELAILNLAINAHDAMSDGGRLTIRAWREADPAAPGLAEGEYIALSVADTGQGMDADTLARAVEPFFTTKGVGRGTGLGLSSVHGLAVQSGGAFVLESEPGEGAKATLWLPVAHAVAEPLHTPDVEAPAAPRCARILLVDDEDLVRGGATALLEDAGYEVVHACSGDEALKLAGENTAFDMLITDYAMPGMTGAELARRIRAERPRLPILMITGYANLSDTEAGDWPRLAKPFRQVELAMTVSSLLEGAEG